MLLAITAVILGAVFAVVAVRLRESQLSVNDLFADLKGLGTKDGQLAHTPDIVSAETYASAIPAVSQPADVGFTETLLALSRVGSRAPDDSRELELAESSSLVLVRPVR